MRMDELLTLCSRPVGSAAGIAAPANRFAFSDSEKTLKTIRT